MSFDLRAARRANLARLLAPRSIAFIGGSRAAPAIRVARENGYAGRLYAVNPRLAEIEGVACVPTVADLPEPPDASFLVTPIDASIEALRELARIGAGSAVCYAAGFAELGPDGRRKQDELVEAAGPLALVGPNCFGVINYVSGASLWPVPYPREDAGTGVAVVAQSGNLAINLSQSQRSVPWSYIISVGNQAALGVEDYIAHLAHDPEVKVIGLFLEGLRDVPAFHEAALDAAARGVPLVILKSGVSTVGAELALSHTSSVAGADAMYDALFARVGAIRVRTLPEMEETLKLLALWGAEPGRRVAVFSSSGGDAGMAADFAASTGLELPQPDAEQRRAIAAELPEYGQVSNPLDFTATLWGADAPLVRVFAAMMASGVDKAVLVVDRPRPELNTGPAVETMAKALAAAYRATGVPAAVASVNPELLPAALRAQIIGDGIVPLQGLHDALPAIAAAARHAEFRTALLAGPRPAALVAPRPVDAAAAHVLDEHASKAALAAYGLVVPASRVAGRDAVAEAALSLGFPVAIKALHAALPHKTEAGAVALNIATPESAEAAASAIAAAVAAYDPAIAVERFLVERMAPRAVAELLVGVQRDAQFGPVLVIGAGGILVELLRQATTLLLPASQAEIETALRRGIVGRQLGGFRGGERGDVAAATAAVLAVARFAEAHPDRLVELDVNPLMVLPEGRGAVAVDALVRLVGAPR